MKVEKNVLQPNTHRLKESDFQFGVTVSRWRPWRHFTQKPSCCLLLNEHDASGHAAPVQFLIYSTFVFVLLQVRFIPATSILLIDLTMSITYSIFTITRRFD